MKKNILSLLLIAAIQTMALGQSSILKVDTKESQIHWIGKKVTGQHEGNIKLNSGSIAMDDKNIVGGSFEVDMASIVCTDLSGEYGTKLEKHLKSNDFFGVDDYPIAQMNIKGADQKMTNHFEVTGELTIRGITHPINFEMHLDGDQISTKLIVDRSKYDVRYRSGSFFENLGDKMIYDDFELDIILKL
ncbi:MAG: YceI family protein [Flavobacteriaceae bacterium]